MKILLILVPLLFLPGCANLAAGMGAMGNSLSGNQQVRCMQQIAGEYIYTTCQ